MTSWIPSQMNYDMLGLHPADTMRLNVNSFADHSRAWSGLFNYPQYNFGSVMQYADTTSINPYLTNPNYTIAQMSWGTPMWNNNMWNMNNCGWGQHWGWNWNGGNTSGTSTTTTPEDEKFRTKYNRLLTLVKQIMEYEYLSEEDKSELKVASRSTKGSYEEKYNKLKEAYDKVDKETVRDFLVDDAKKVGVTEDIKNNEKHKDSFHNRLLGAGYEKKDTIADEAAELLYKDIKDGLANNDGSATYAEGVVQKLGRGDKKINVLDFISSWNSNYKKEEGSERIIDHISKNWDKVEDEEMKETLYTGVLRPLVKALISEAEEVRKSLDEDSREAMKSAIEALETALSNSETGVDGELSAAFDKVYLLTRNGSMAKLRSDIVASYGDIDEKVFNNNLFSKEVTEDLISEGFTSDDIQNASVKVGEKEDRRSRRRDDADGTDGADDATEVRDIDKKTVTEQVATLKKDGVIRELSIKYGQKTVYEEKTMTGDSDGDGKADYAKLYYVNSDGKLVEWENVKLKGDKFVLVKAGVAQGEIEVKASEIQNSKKKAETKKKDEEAGNDAKANGKMIATEYLKFGWTDSWKHEKINKCLSKLNKNNIVEFLEGYYVDGKQAGATEGLIEKLDDEYDGGAITMANKKKVITSLLDVAKQEGLTDSAHYIALKDMMDAYKEDKARSSSSTFNNGGWARLFNGEGFGSLLGGATAGAATGVAASATATFFGLSNPIGWVAAAGAAIWGLCDKVTDNEVIDKHLEALFNEIKSKRA